MALEEQVEQYGITIADRSVFKNTAINIFSFDTASSDKLAHKDYILQIKNSVLKDVVFNFPEEYQSRLDGAVEDFKTRVSELEAERLSSEERRAIRKYADDCELYREKYGEDIELNKLLENLEDYRIRLYSAYVGFGDRDFKEGDTKRAIEHYDEALEIYPEHDTQALNMKGYVFLQLKKYGNALDCFNEALKLNTNDFTAQKEYKKITTNRYKFEYYVNKGNQLLNRGKFRRAIRKFNKALKLSPDSVEVKGHLREARSELEELIENKVERNEKIYSSIVFTSLVGGLTGLTLGGVISNIIGPDDTIGTLRDGLVGLTLGSIAAGGLSYANKIDYDDLKSLALSYSIGCGGLAIIFGGLFEAVDSTGELFGVRTSPLNMGLYVGAYLGAMISGVYNFFKYTMSSLDS